MRDWYSGPELAGLPGLPETHSAIIRKAKRDHWTSRPRAGRGGGSEYHIASLPETARRALLRRSVAQLAVVADMPRDLPRVDELKAWQREVLMARLAVCAMLDELQARTGCNAVIAAETLLGAAVAGDLTPEQIERITLANARRGRGSIPSVSTLLRWRADFAQGPAALAPRPSKSAVWPVWMAPLLALYQRPQKPSVAACVRNWSEHYPSIPAPELRSAQRHIQSLPIEVREYGRRGRNARRAVQPFVRRSTDGLWPMDVVTVDGHLFKAYVRHPMTGRKLRPEITTYLDIATRKAIGFSAWLAESQMAIWAALRDMVLDPACGVPALHYSDNGAYQGESHKAVMARIGTTMMFSEPYRAQARGVIERLNSSVWVPLAKEHATYVNDDADREAVKRALKRANDDGGNLMGWQEFIAQARSALDSYNARPHKSNKGKSPDEAWAQAVAEGWRPTLLEDDDLHDLLPQTARTINRGWVSLPWGHYFHDRLRDYHAQKISIGVHPTDGARVWCSESGCGALICVAERDANTRPYVPASMLEHARALREAGRVRRLERKIEAAHEEGSALIHLPQADVSGPRPLPDNGPEMLTEEAPDQYETWFNSATRQLWQQQFGEQLLATEADEEDRVADALAPALAQLRERF